MAWKMSGSCHRRFWPMAEAFRSNFDEGRELGASLSMTWRGRKVVDLWGGWADTERTKSWGPNTIVQVFSVTKIMLIMSILNLLDRGLLELDRPVATYWPEFAQGGKGAVTVRDVLTHQGGLPSFDPPLTFEEAHDWKAVTTQLAGQPHRFGGKKVLCYHAFTYGYILGELIVRVTGSDPASFFAETFARRVKADFQMRLTHRSDIRRVSPLDMSQAMPPPVDDEIAAEVIGSVAQGDLMSPGRLGALMPAANGYGNGRSIARLCAIMAMNGKLGGHRYISRQMVAEATREQIYGRDLYIGMISWGLGFGLNSIDFPAPSPTAFHWGGAGGAWGVMDPRYQVSLGYAPNRFGRAGASMDPRLARLSDAMTGVLRTLPR